MDKLLIGAKATRISREHRTGFEVTTNLKTAKVLGLTIPQSILFPPDEVIQ